MDDVAYLKRMMRRKGTTVPAHTRPQLRDVAGHFLAITLLTAGAIAVLAVPSLTVIATIASVMVSGQ